MFSWINARYVVSATRREVLIAWMASTAERLLASTPSAYGPAASSLVFQVPHSDVITDVLRTIWAVAIQPGIEQRDKLAARMDG